VLLQSTTLKQARSPIASVVRPAARRRGRTTRLSSCLYCGYRDFLTARPIQVSVARQFFGGRTKRNSMDREFSRKELYDLIWAQPMKTVAASVGISDVALAKHCKRANIPAPQRGYWARKSAGKPTIQIALPPRFPGASDHVGAPRNQRYGSWPEEYAEMTIPPVPIFEEDMSSVEVRARKLVGRVRYLRKFEPAHPLIAKLLARDDENRKEFLKSGFSWYAPKFDSGIERRRLLIINSLFVAAQRIGCSASMNTSRYRQDPGSERDLCIKAGERYTYFTVEPLVQKKEQKEELLKLSFGTARNRTKSDKSWLDGDERALQDKLNDVLVEILTSAEIAHRESLVRHREWIIERKVTAQAEIKRRAEETERKAKELAEKRAQGRIDHLLAQAKAFDQANQIRAYVESVLSRSAGISTPQYDLERWAAWARQEADRIDPTQNDSIVQAIKRHSDLP
jgi:hypothetical protein